MSSRSSRSKRRRQWCVFYAIGDQIVKAEPVLRQSFGAGRLCCCLRSPRDALSRPFHADRENA